jgi:hypothetical protein
MSSGETAFVRRSFEKSGARPRAFRAQEPFSDFKACPVICYGEATLLRFPWAGLDAGPPLRRLFQVAGAEPDSRFERWSVQAGPLGPAGPFERSVFRAIEWMVFERSIVLGRRFVNPLVFHPWDVCERLCLKKRNSHFEAIGRALQILAGVEIEAAGGRSFRFRLLRRVTELGGPTMDPKAPARRYAVTLDPFYVDWINAGSVAALNWRLWVSLRRPLARRLVEILDAEAPGTDGAAPFRVPLDRLCRLLPVSAPLPGLRGVLDQAHKELEAHEYLARTEWAGLHVEYTPGAAYTSLRGRLRLEGLPHARPGALVPDHAGSA